MAISRKWCKKQLRTTNWTILLRIILARSHSTTIRPIQTKFPIHISQTFLTTRPHSPVKHGTRIPHHTATISAIWYGAFLDTLGFQVIDIIVIRTLVRYMGTISQTFCLVTISQLGLTTLFGGIVISCGWVVVDGAAWWFTVNLAILMLCVYFVCEYWIGIGCY